MTDLDVPTVLDPAVAAPPRYAHGGDAGADLCVREAVTLAPGERALVGTGVSVAIPAGYVGLVHPRSGLAHRHGLSLVNAPGVIDSGYRGEIMLNLINLDPVYAVTLEAGDRAAQLLVQQVERVRFTVVPALGRTDRHTGGHGSTGR
ncbi:dUTP diphosphatase [Cumulibacter manganitolerans]|uniref:dUTP diphosphatase n=1 Tax=Cumulibacter manganitolerans TaxID=1884992 RepID=UPI001296366D|nr:dUTP diphosphatase [Cumulibacter manganitolerans]